MASTGPSPRLLNLLLILVAGALGAAGGRYLMGVVGATVGGLFGAALGWAVARAIHRSLF